MQPEEGPVEGEEDEPQEKQKPKVKPLKQKKAPAYGVEGQEQNPMLNEKEWWMSYRNGTRSFQNNRTTKTNRVRIRITAWQTKHI